MRKKTNLKKENGKKEKLRFPSNTSLIFFFLRGSMLYFFAGAVFACLVAFFDLIIPRLIQYTVDAVIGGDLSAVPGWAAGNIVIGLALGALFRFTRDREFTLPVAIISGIVIVAACAVGILGVKSAVEWMLYSQPFVLRVAKNVYAFWADAFVLIVSLPICRIIDRRVLKYLPEGKD